MERKILLRYIEGDASVQEKESVARWIDADEKNYQEFLLLRNIHDATLWNEPDTNYISRKTRRYIPLFGEIIKIAAIFAIAFGCFRLFYSYSPEIEPQQQTIYVPEGQRAELTLADGTHVWLNAKSQLTFPTIFTDKERKVELNGEGYFDVEKDSKKYFIVQTPQHQVKVLGTEFNVKAYPETGYFETALLKGSVEVIVNGTTSGVILEPDKRLFTKDGQLTLANIRHYDEFLWKEGIISFENETVKDIFDKLELYYDVKIDVNNDAILPHIYTGKFRTKDGVEHVLKVLQLKHKFRYMKDNETNTISIF